MNTQTRIREPGTRGKVVGVLIVAACVLACTLPIIGGLLAGGFVDRVLDSPAWITLLIGAAAALAIAMARRRAKTGTHGC